jgi:chemotaxis protein MotB
MRTYGLLSFGRAWNACLVTLALGTSTLACGPSQDEYDAKVREVDRLKTLLAAEQGESAKAKQELDESQRRINLLKDQLKNAGVDISNLNANLEQQAKALEDYKKRAEQLEKIRQRFELLRQKLDALTKLGLKVVIRGNRMVIQLPGDVLFDTGKETLKKEGKDILLKVAEVIRNDAGLASRTFQVAGHTDNQPLSGGRFKDNWGLSAMRAREVLVFLLDPADKGGGGLNPKTWSASGYGEVDPIAKNDTPEGKQANRRVELVLVPSAEEILDLKSLTK